MKRVIPLLFFPLFLFGYVYSQVVETANVLKSDTLVVQATQEEFADFFRASAYCKQVRVSYALSNKSYNNRLMLTASSGLTPCGWAIIASASAHFGTDITYAKKYGAITDDTGFSAYLGVEKKFNQEHALILTASVFPTERSMQTGAVQEAYDLTGSHYYNSNWGLYEGKKRNTNINTIMEPDIRLSHYFTPKNNKYTITTVLATNFGRNNITGLNWGDAPDPRPDYYKNLPGFYLNNKDTAMYYAWRNAWLTNENIRQINWHKMYELNQLAAKQGKSAQYIVENCIIDHLELNGTSNLIMDLSKNIKLSTRLDIRGLKQHNYKTINDLLGGTYWIDVANYSENAFPDAADIQYNDLNNTDAPLHKDDIFGYNYNFLVYNQKAYTTLDFTYAKIDFYIGGQLGATEMWRVGFMKNGRFATTSEGKSKVKSFFEGGAKASITCKISNRNDLALNGEFLTNAPNVSNAFLTPNLRNTFVFENDPTQKLKTEKMARVDLSYLMRYPFMKMRANLYFTQHFDVTKIISFYSDDEYTMVNDVITGMGQRHLGAALEAEIKLCSFLWLVLAGNFGDYRYSNNPLMITNTENGYDILQTGEVDTKQVVYWKNFRVAGAPQMTGTFGLKFNYNHWGVNLNANYLDGIWCGINPNRRTLAATETLDRTIPEQDALYHQIVDQTRMKGQFTLDLSVSKSWRIKRYTVGFNVSVTNITNNKNLITNAWETYRFDYKDYNPDKLVNQYNYAFGTTFMAGVYFMFN